MEQGYSPHALMQKSMDTSGAVVMVPSSVPSSSNASPLSPPIQCPNSPQQRRHGKRHRFTPEDDLIILREVAAANAHVAGYGEIQKSFAVATENANCNPSLSAKVTAKSLQDRYKKLLENFRRADAADRRMSGVGGEMCEMDELLGMMEEARNDVQEKQSALKLARERQDAEKERLGKELVSRSLARRKSDGVDIEAGESFCNDDEPPRTKRKLGKRGEKETIGELASFGESLRQADIARIDIERERLQLERERLETEKEEREKDRELQREERRARDKLEIEKFKLMMAAFCDSINDKK